jgi:DNA polymerase V
MVVEDLLRASPDRVQALLGVVGSRLRQELLGLPAYPLTAKTAPQKSVMHSRSFRQSVTDIAVLHDALAYHVRHAAADLRMAGQKASLLRVFIQPSRHGDYVLRGGALEAVLVEPTNDTFVLIKTAENLLKQCYESAVPYRKAGVVLSGLVSAVETQTPLFIADRSQVAQPELMRVVDKLNGSRETVFFGSRLRNKAWQAKAEARSPAYTTRWAEVATVKAV